MIYKFIPQIISTIEQYGFPDDNGEAEYVISDSTPHLAIEKGEDFDLEIKRTLRWMTRFMLGNNALITKLPRRNIELNHFDPTHIFDTPRKYNRYHLFGDEFYFLHHRGIDIKIERELWDCTITIALGVKERE